MAIELMTRFAERTGVTTEPSRRYLWTDAFAACNLLGLSGATGDSSYRELALRLVDRVHHVLGRHRTDDRRSGWISGLPAAEGEAHPTSGGLRIGKSLPERKVDEPPDERLEWERDGQYFHYLTKWMHALDQVARVTRQPLFNAWGRELAEAAHRGFTYTTPAGDRRMCWKASIDLSRPLVAAMGQHDPIDGLVTCLELDDTAVTMGAAAGESMVALANDYAAMIDPETLATSDPLGIGGLLVDAYRLQRLASTGQATGHRELVGLMLDAAHAGLRRYLGRGELGAPAERRLAFRELGLAIGLAAASRFEEGVHRVPRASQLRAYLPIRTELESFWLEPAHLRSKAWLDHEDINAVMLATCLAPEGFLIRSPIERPVARGAEEPG
jgi:hypothetical protein